MAITSQILKKESVKKGYDIKVKYLDSETGKEYIKVFFFKADSEPSDKDLTERISHIKGNVEDLIVDESSRLAHPPMDREQVEKILRDKELLGADEHIEDLKSKTELLK